MEDPVLRRRAQVLRLTGLGQRVGYLCFGVALVLFFVGLAADMPGWVATSIAVLMVVGSVVLLPAIVFSHAARAADKEDRGETSGY